MQKNICFCLKKLCKLCQPAAGQVSSLKVKVTAYIGIVGNNLLAHISTLQYDDICGFICMSRRLLSHSSGRLLRNIQAFYSLHWTFLSQGLQSKLLLVLHPSSCFVPDLSCSAVLLLPVWNCTCSCYLNWAICLFRLSTGRQFGQGKQGTESPPACAE